MNNNDSQAEYRHCPHKHCIGHDPEWEVSKEESVLIPTGIFRRKIRWLRCCGKPMLRIEREQVVTERCKKCGNLRSYVQSKSRLARCECCEKTLDLYQEEARREMEEFRRTEPSTLD